MPRFAGLRTHSIFCKTEFTVGQDQSRAKIIPEKPTLRFVVKYGGNLVF